ncbi:MAG: HAD hydrolase family protein [Candidatus Latescibacteria bacterium]|nr:HAD hydrolase family protein [Candidatus Latescibacterota bacterium]
MTDYLLTEKLALIKLFAMDVDGTFTDGTLYYDSKGEVIKGFSSADGMGIELLHRMGIKRGFISGRTDVATKTRAEYLDVDFYLPSIGDKSVALRNLAEKYNITLDECLYMGDDLNDITALQIAGVSVTVANANTSVKRFTQIVTEKEGGRGAVREVVDLILETQGIDPVTLWMSDKDRPVGMQ